MKTAKEMFRMINKDRWQFLYLVGFDILFFAVLYFIFIFINRFFPQTPAEVQQAFGQMNPILIVLILVVLYFFIPVIAHTYFKYLSLNSVVSFFKKTKLSYSRIKEFFALNIILYAILLLIFTMLSFAIVGVKESILGNTAITVGIIYFIFSYTLIQISHSLFALGFKVRKVFQNNFYLTFTGIPAHVKVFLIDFIVIIAYFLFYYIIGNIIGRSITDIATLTQISTTYNKIFTLTTVLLILFLLNFNKLYFYAIVQKLKKS